MIYLVALLLALWFWRRSFKDAGAWMIATYAGIAFLMWTDFSAVSAAGGTLNEALPRIVRDFLLLGMVGFVQSLAVNKRMPIWLAVILTLVIFALAHFLEFEAPGQSTALTTDPAPATTPLSAAELDPEGELLVQVSDEQSLEELLAMAATNDWDVKRAFFPAHSDQTELDDYYTVDVSGSASVAATEQILKTTKGVVYFEPNEVVRLDDPVVVPNVQRPSPRLSINDPETAQQWMMEKMRMEDYYQLLAKQTPVKRARIAILDTGVDSQHEDLKDNFFSIDKKYNDDPMGHGTHCAGIAAGVTNNGIGIGSLAGSGRQPFVSVSSIKVLSASGMGTQKSIIAGILEAADEGVDVISLSLGGRSNGSRQKAYSQAVKYARSQGCIVVAAAGNSNMNAKDYSPANAKGMITVAALDQDLKRAVFSNTVQNVKNGISAPGVAIFSTMPNNNYRASSGTSMACPYVAGLLGVMRSVNPDLDADEAYRIIHSTGAETVDGQKTGKVVQPAAALREALARR